MGDIEEDAGIEEEPLIVGDIDGVTEIDGVTDDVEITLGEGLALSLILLLTERLSEEDWLEEGDMEEDCVVVTEGVVEG